MLLACLPLLAQAAEPAAVVRLDAGPLPGLVLDGFDRLDPSGSTDPRARWATPPAAVRAVTAPDPLAADGLVGGVLHLDLPPGRWQLAAMLGDPQIAQEDWATRRWGLRVDGEDALVVTPPPDLPGFLASDLYAANPRPVFRPGETAFDRQAAPHSRWSTATVDVGPHGLDLAPFGQPLRAVVLAPDGFDLPSELALVDARRARWWSERLHPAADRLPAIASGPPTATLAPLDDRDPSAIEALPPLELARGDRSTRLVWIGGGDGGGTATVVAPEGLVARLAEVTWLDDTAQSADPVEPRPTVVQAWDGVFRGGQGVPPALALEVRSTADARPGRYPVRIEVRRGDAAARLDVPVVVHAVDVGDRPHGGLFTEVPQAPRLRLGLHHPETLRLLDAQLDALADLGLDAVSLRNATDVYREPDDVGVMQHAAERWKADGGVALVWFDVMALLRFTGDGAPDARVARMLSAAAHAPLPVWPILFEEDDWRQEGALALGRARFERARRLEPAATLLASPSTPAGWPVLELADVGLVGGERGLLAAAVRRSRDWGARTWVYNLAPGASGPLQAWAVGADGLLEWHADPFPYDPYDLVLPFDRRTHLVLGPDGAFHPFVRLLDLADGLADARLLASLEDRLDRLPPTHRERAERLLAATRAVLLQAPVIPGARGVALAAVDRARVRARALALLERVPK